MSRLSDIEVFTAVVDTGSFSAAARSLGISKSYTSKQIQQLEERLGARLLQRTTRRLSLTAAGRSFHQRCTAIMEELEEAERAVTALQTRPRGILRMAAPMSFGVRYVAPALADFMKRYPELEVEVSYSDRTVDLIDEGYDLAVRGGTLEDSSLVARKFAPLSGVLAASPDYLAAHGTPQTPHDLKDHACLLYTNNRAPGTWAFAGPDGEPFNVRVDGPYRADNGDALIVAAKQGLGIVAQPDFLIGEAIHAGELVPILQGWYRLGGALWVVYPHHRHLSAKVRLFVDFLVERFEDPPWTLCADVEASQTAAP